MSRYDKFGNYDGAHDLPRRQIDNRSIQSEYDAHYDHALWLLEQGCTPRQILYFDPSLERPLADYLAV